MLMFQVKQRPWRGIEARLQYFLVERIGGDKPVSVNVRVLVATHRDLEAGVREEKFRQDLFHRIHVFPLTLPPLRERRDDIPALVEHFAAQVCAQNGWKPVPFTADAIEALQSHPWPGNVRELRNMVERLMLLATEGQVDLATVQMALPKTSPGGSFALELGHHPPHGFAVPHDFVLAQPQAQLPVLALQTLQLKRVVHGQHQFVA